MSLLSNLLNISLRLAVADTNANPNSSQRVVAYTSITAPRTITLPAASSIPAGQTITVIDESGQVSSTNTITISTTGTDIINTSSSYTLSIASSTVTFESNGSNLWGITTQTVIPQSAASLGLPSSGVLSRGKIVALAIRY